MGAVRKIVLMIEDNPADAEIIREELSETNCANFTIEVATTLTDGLSYVEEHPVAGILLDLSLPDSHGLETFKRAREKAPDLPIIVLTGNDDEELGLQAVREGAQDYLVKGHLQGAGLARAIDYAVERKLVETRLRRAKKMEAVSQVSNGLISDFNNVLSVVLMKLQSLEWPNRDDEYLLGQINDARLAVFRGANLTKRLSSFASSDVRQKKTLDVNPEITKLSDLLGNVDGSGFEIETNLAKDAWPVHLDPLELEMALMNLVANARDSMAGRGRVNISTENVAVAEGEFAEDDAVPGPYVVLAVSDIGVGMSEKQRLRAIEPFFTTKSGGEGYGLGLSMVSGFVRQSKGFMQILTTEGAGTCVKLFLPSVTRTLSEEALQDAQGPTGLANGETVLVLDSDPKVCDAISVQLGELGYTPRQAATPAGALDVLQADSEVKAVLMDVLLSDDIDCASLTNLIVETRPDVKVLFTSAHARSAFKTLGIPTGVEDVLFKPYCKSDLANKLGQLSKRRTADLATLEGEA